MEAERISGYMGRILWMVERIMNVEEVPIEEGDLCYSCRGSIDILYAICYGVSVGVCSQCGKRYHIVSE